MRYTPALLLGLLLVACSDNTEKPGPSAFDLSEGTPDASADMPDPKTPDMPPTPDMMVKPDMPTPPPLRTVLERSPLDAIPPDNRVKDPAFRSMGVAFDWLTQPANSQGFNPATAYRRTMEEVPVPDLPVLHMPKAPLNPNALQTYGTVIHNRQATEVSIWLGRKGGEVGPEAQVLVTGLDVNNPTNYLGQELFAVPATTQTLGDYTWTQYAGTIQDFLGYGYLVVSDTSPTSLYLQAPSARPTSAGPGLLRPHVTATARSLTSRERTNLRHIEQAAKAWRRDQQERHHIPRTLLPQGIR